MQQDIDLNMTSLEREIYEIILDSDKPLTASDIILLCPNHKWFDRSLHPVLNHLVKKKSDYYIRICKDCKVKSAFV